MGRLEHEELRIVLLNTKNVVLRVATVIQTDATYRRRSLERSCRPMTFASRADKGDGRRYGPLRRYG